VPGYLSGEYSWRRRVAGVVGKVNDATADHVVRVPLKTLLPTGQPLQTFGRGTAAGLCLSPLEASAHFGVTAADVVERSAAEEALALTVRDGRQPVDAAGREGPWRSQAPDEGGVGGDASSVLGMMPRTGDWVYNTSRNA
jgi:hypothetical protein